MSLVISVHDVAPETVQGAHALWTLCLTRGVRAALVVSAPTPALHGGALPSPFVDWLRARVEQGSRILLHVPPAPVAPVAPLRAASRAMRGGDADGLADRALADCVQRVRRHGLSPIGAMAPRRGARAELRRAAAAAGLRVMEDARFVWRLLDETPLAAPIVRIDARPARERPRALAARWRSPLASSFARLHLSATMPLTIDARAAIECTLEQLLQTRPAVTHDAVITHDAVGRTSRSAA